MDFYCKVARTRSHVLRGPSPDFFIFDFGGTQCVGAGGGGEGGQGERPLQVEVDRGGGVW